MTKWGRRSKITFVAALLAELFLPSPAVHDDLWIFGPSQEASDLAAALAAQDLHTPDLLSLESMPVWGVLRTSLMLRPPRSRNLGV